MVRIVGILDVVLRRSRGRTCVLRLRRLHRDVVVEGDRVTQGSRVEVVFECAYTGNQGTAEYVCLLDGSVGIEMDSGRWQVFHISQLKEIEDE